MEKLSAVSGGGGGAVHFKTWREGKHGWERDVNTAAAARYVIKRVFLCLCQSGGEFTILVLQTCCCVDDHQTAELWFSAAVCTLSGGAIHMGLLRMLMISPAACVIHKVSWLRTGSMWGLFEPLFWFPHTPFFPCPCAACM